MKNRRIVGFGLMLSLGIGAAGAADGLVPPAAETLWPQWQARITLQSASVSPLALSGLVDDSAQRGLRGGAVLGDYYFASPSFGNFRASGGLLVGSTGGAPLLSTGAGPRLDLTLSNGSTLAPGADTPGTVPYLGLGFSGAAWRSALSFSADVGLAVERPSAAGGLGRAIFGNQPFEAAVREMRFSPVLQLGVRYSF